MHPENPVVKLCVAGMQAEGRGDPEGARRLFAEAWDTAGDNFEACIAAHYLARHQPTPQDELWWNEESLRLAEAVGDRRVAYFFPSLWLNVGRSHEVLGHAADAKQYYDLAAAGAEALPVNRYGTIVRDGAAAGQQRSAAVACTDESVCRGPRATVKSNVESGYERDTFL